MSLAGKHVAVTGARKGEEISQLIVNMEGIPYVRPTQGTVFLDESQVAPDIHRLLNEGTDWLILTTGIGAQTLLDMAEGLGLRERLIELLKRVKVAARGYKTRQLLKGLGITPAVSDDDGTVRGLIRQFADISLSGERVALQLYGELPDALRSWLTDVGAAYTEIMPYRHMPPPETEIAAFIDELLEGKFDAVAFTSSLQVQYLFQAAARYDAAGKLREQFAGGVVAAAVGIVTAEALEEAGVSRIVQPDNQRMGGMIVELSRYYDSNR